MGCSETWYVTWVFGLVSSAAPILAGVPLPQNPPSLAVRTNPYPLAALLRRQNAGRSAPNGNRDVNTPFPKNLRDPVHAETATVRSKISSLYYARPHRALRSRPRRRPRPRIRPRGVMEYWSVECCANSELHPRSGLEI